MDVGNLGTLVNDAVGQLEILTKCSCDSDPAIGICRTLALQHEVLENRVAMLLDALDILEEAVSLVLEDLSSESSGRLRRYDRWVERVQHCNAVVLVERTEL